jgi:hypothetical protein
MKPRAWDHASEHIDGGRNHDADEGIVGSSPGPGRRRGPGRSGLRGRHRAPPGALLRAGRAPATGHGIPAGPAQSGRAQAQLAIGGRERGHHALCLSAPAAPGAVGP